MLAPAQAAARSLASELVAAAPAANPKVLELAARAAECARRRDGSTPSRHLAVIDYSLPSTQRRLWVFDVERGRLLFEELVAHGRNTGETAAEHFSNIEGSKMSSVGLFQTAETYYGSNGYSLRLRGLDPGFNDNALSRAIVMHGAPYVSQAIADRLGRLGRSWGCPAVRAGSGAHRHRHAEGRAHCCSPITRTANGWPNRRISSATPRRPASPGAMLDLPRPRAGLILLRQSRSTRAIRCATFCPWSRI